MSEDGELFDRALLRRRRARFAGEMAEHEALLAHVAAEIADRVSAILREFPLALDLGAYHGVLGRAVAALPSVGAMIYAESVPALAALCPRPAVVCDEELLPFKEQSLNLVVSGLALHRVNDLPGALIQIRRALRPDGLFIAAALGSRSLHELREALIEAEAELHGGASPRVAPFADVREYGALLQRAGFALPVTDAELLTVTYPSPRALMREIRALGGGNVMAARRKMPLPRGTLERAEEIYRERHSTPEGKIAASFEIVYLAGWAPDASQQKPLAPGSAKARLADALHTTEHSAGDKAAFPAKKTQTLGVVMPGLDRAIQEPRPSIRDVDGRDCPAIDEDNVCFSEAARAARPSAARRREAWRRRQAPWASPRQALGPHAASLRPASACRERAASTGGSRDRRGWQK